MDLEWMGNRHTIVIEPRVLPSMVFLPSLSPVSHLGSFPSLTMRLCAIVMFESRTSVGLKFAASFTIMLTMMISAYDVMHWIPHPNVFLHDGPDRDFVDRLEEGLLHMASSRGHADNY